MKKFFAKILAILFIPAYLLAGYALPKVYAAESEALNWYCKIPKNGEQPPLPTEFTFILEHGGYYLDLNADGNDKVIYLTFDAGYENGNIEKILDIMKEHDVKGAFFVLENLIVRNTELVKRMVDDGHLVCNHTASHRDMTCMRTKEEFKKELDKLNAIMNEYCGCDIKPFYRPPEGRFNKDNLIWANELGYKTIMWSCAYADWDNQCQPAPENAYARLMSRLHNGEILLLHPTSSTNAAILDKLITNLKSQGYRFGSLNELREKQ